MVDDIKPYIPFIDKVVASENRQSVGLDDRIIHASCHVDCRVLRSLQSLAAQNVLVPFLSITSVRRWAFESAL